MLVTHPPAVPAHTQSIIAVGPEQFLAGQKLLASCEPLELSAEYWSEWIGAAAGAYDAIQYGGIQVEMPQLRPGKVAAGDPMPRVIAFFADASQGNAAIQYLVQLGVRSDRLGVTPPDLMPHGRGMLLSIAYPDPATIERVESYCRKQGAKIHRQRG